MDLTKARPGDVYEVYVTTDDRVSEFPTSTILRATVVAIRNTAIPGKLVILGWESKRLAPRGAYDSNNVILQFKSFGDYTYIPNAHEYPLIDAVWETTAAYRLVSEGIATPTSAPTHPVPTTDIADWKAWRDQGLQPGECACGIPREKCEYHRGG